MIPTLVLLTIIVIIGFAMFVHSAFIDMVEDNKSLAKQIVKRF